MTKALVVGTGSAGRRLAQNLQTLGLAVEVCSEHQRRSEFVLDGGSVPVHHDYRRALDGNPAIVVIANSTHLHADYAVAALEQGRHLFLEKPAAQSASHAEPIARAAAAAPGAVVAICNQHRFNDCLQRLRDLLAGGELGPLISVQHNMGEFLPDYHPDEDYRTGYAARADMGGGVLLTQIHDVNLLHWLFGDLRVEFAAGGHTSSLEIDVEDNVDAVLSTSDGVRILMHVDYLQRPKRRTLAVLGERGSAVWDHHANTLTFVPTTGVPSELGPGVPLDRHAIALRVVDNFLAATRGLAEPRTSLADALADLRVVDAIKSRLKSSGRGA
ncbi:MAG: Gfo/Idh/MocA family protein [Vicinamibacterales bacterium]